MTCRPSEGRPPQAIQARHQPDVAGAPSERLVAPRFCGVSIMEADQCFTITHCAVSEAASSANKSWWKRDHFRIAVLAFDLVIRFPAARSAQRTIPTRLPWRRASRRSAPIPTMVSPTRVPPRNLSTTAFRGTAWRRSCTRQSGRVPEPGDEAGRALHVVLEGSSQFLARHTGLRHGQRFLRRYCDPSRNTVWE